MKLKNLIEQRFPLYEANVDGVKSYIVPLKRCRTLECNLGIYCFRKKIKTPFKELFLIIKEKQQV